MRFGLAALLTMSLASISLATPPRFAKGEKVQVERGFQTFEGEVVSVTRVGWVNVKFTDEFGNESTQLFPPRRVQKIKKGREPAKADPLPKLPGARKPLDDEAKPEEPSDNPSDLPNGDWSHLEAIPISDLGAWALKPDPAPPLALHPKAIPLRVVKSGGFPHATRNLAALILNRARREAFVFSPTFGTGFGRKGDILVHRMDLEKGKSASTTFLNTNGTVLDVDPSGQRVAISVGIPGRLSASRLEIWQLGESKGRLVAAWNPLDERAGSAHSPAPRFARFIDPDHLLVVNWPSTLVLWDVPNKRVVYTLQLTGGEALALSPGGKYLAVSVASGVALLDPLTGATRGRLDTNYLSQAELSFQPDGKRLAAVSAGHVLVWDFEKGEEIRDFFFPTPTLPGRLDWVADGYLLAAGTKLIDLERRIVLWEYEPPSPRIERDRTCGELGGVFWYTAGNGQEGYLVGVKLPHEAARQMAASLNADALLALKPGASVNLTVRLQGTPGEEAKARQALSDQLQKLGIGVDPKSPIVLAATTETGRTREHLYREWGFTFAETKFDKANVTEHISRIRLMEGGKVLWEAASVSGAPTLFYRKKDQTLQQAVDEMDPDNKNFFNDVQLPQYIARPGDGGAYGASLLSEAGIRNVPLAQLRRNTVVQPSDLEPRIGRRNMRMLGLDPSPAPVRGRGDDAKARTGGL